jgi:hypothetical protein
VITTAPTNTQVEEILWREIHTAHRNAKIPLGGKLTATQLDLQDSVPGKSIKWFAFGFSTRKDTVQENATKMQGFHNDYVLIVFDEADGIEPAIWKSVDGLLTSENAKFVAIGNPMRPTGEFADCFSSKNYRHVTISVKDTPNFIEGREVIPGISGRKYEEDMRIKWGENSDMYRSRVLGQIPTMATDSIVSVTWYESAEGRVIADTSTQIKLFLTVDVADGGSDDTTVKCWRNKTMTREERFPGKRADEVYADVWRICKEHGGNTIVYDNDGCGRVLGGLLRGVVSEGIDIIAFDGSAEPNDDTDFLNRRAEGHFAMFQDFKNNTISVLPNNPRMKRDITSIKWGTPKKGKICVEPKEDFKSRNGGESPDDGDPVMMMSACYSQIKPIEIIDRYSRNAPHRQAEDYSWRVA